MSSAFRSLARLPLDMYTNVQFEQSTDALTLRECICAKLRRNKTGPIETVGAFLKLSCEALVRILDPIFTYEECIAFRKQLHVFCSPRPVSALSLLRKIDQQPPLSTGMQALDTCLKGGIRSQSICEIVGAAGVGKTQFAMQLCVEAARRGMGAVYIDTERKLNIGRLHEIAKFRCNDISKRQGGDDDAFHHNEEPHFDEIKGDYKHASQVLSNVTVRQSSTLQELLLIVRNLEEEVLLRNEEALSSDNSSTFEVHLLILDSIAAPSKQEFAGGATAAAERSAVLMELASELKRLADQMKLYVVVINQIVSSNSTKVRPALGNSWHHCLSTRIFLENLEKSDSVRRATLVKSHLAGNDCAYYSITMRGLEQALGPVR